MTSGAAPKFLSENATGIAAMLLSMAAFVGNDTCIKLIGHSLPLGELITLRSAIATLYLVVIGAVFGGLSLPRSTPWRLVSWRLVGEFFATLFFLSGLIALPIADATALTQFTPLAITAAAALFLGEHVGWRRWSATVVGLFGVFMITRPGTAAYSPAALLILIAVGFIVLRDLVTRVITSHVPTLALTAMSTFIGIFSGLVLLPFERWIWPDMRTMLLLLTASAFLCLAFAFTVIAMRHGDVGLVSPFRYAVIVFAILSGWVFWRDWPDGVQMSGIVVLTLAGLYTFHRERALKRIR
jgi:drug/metabolite transporter (DMT)-like permease